ncbi:unnamed protein product [Prorocentrum cordatum]|uniref:Uncharacterized protein n=1 Tax=Prorocentrum cordatum TaxID=2364126 RepID=A0ABN9QYI5_9DINO|nr:unnamed protein product [Polarella glacialis]
MPPPPRWPIAARTCLSCSMSCQAGEIQFAAALIGRILDLPSSQVRSRVQLHSPRTCAASLLGGHHHAALDLASAGAAACEFPAPRPPSSASSCWRAGCARRADAQMILKSPSFNSKRAGACAVYRGLAREVHAILPRLVLFPRPSSSSSHSLNCMCTRVYLHMCTYPCPYRCAYIFGSTVDL